MEKVQTIINLIIAICSLIPTLVSIFCLIKNVIKNKDWSIIQNMAKEAMTSVESYAIAHPGMKGDEKLEMALIAIKNSLNAANIKFDDNTITKIVAYINEMCSWSKTVNK